MGCLSADRNIVAHTVHSQPQITASLQLYINLVCPVQVEVHNPITGKTYCFPCNAWLRDSECRKELLAGSPEGTAPTNYRVTVYTTDVRGAGTDADVYLVIYGQNGDTGERKLDNSTNNFERGKVGEGCGLEL